MDSVREPYRLAALLPVCKINGGKYAKKEKRPHKI